MGRSAWPTIGFLFAGGAHQLLHTAPVAAELLRRGGFDVRLFAATHAEGEALGGLLTRLGVECPIEELALPWWGRGLDPASPLKLPRILSARRVLATLDAVVTAERTSTILKRLPGAKPYLIHIPHGAGDRARGFEPRIRLFDHVVAAGDKDRDRMIAAGLVKPEDCSVSGYVKLAAVRAFPPQPPLFANARPTILYNPHFDARLSSWTRFARPLAQAVAAHGGYNLIVAPHVRLAETMSQIERVAAQTLALNDRILVDLGSQHSYDMTYTQAADLYVGDVSSQVYEYISRARPCLFLDTTGVDHRGDPDFAFQGFGEVVRDPRDIGAGIERAPARFPDFRGVQEEAAERALGLSKGNAVVEAASIVARLATERRERRG